jgi:molybdopterin-synthase adenylyltransferase
MESLTEDRYSRHRLIAGFSQELVAKLHIGIVGAGAIGNEVVKNVLLMGVGYVDLYDFDRAALSNLTRSVFLRESDVGIYKAQAVVERARQLNPTARLRAFSGPIDRELCLTQFSQYDLVIAAVDNIEARLRINDMALLTNTPWINMAIDSRSVVVELFPVHPPSSSGKLPALACYACNLPDSAFERVAQRYSCGGLQRAAYLSRTVPTTAITASTAGALACSELLRYLHAVNSNSADSGGIPINSPMADYNIHSAQRIFFDTVAPSVSRTLLAKATLERGCPGCGLHQSKRLVSAQNLSAVQLVRLVENASNQMVHLSDALIVACHCTHCDKSTSNSNELLALLGARARERTDSLLQCPHCHENAMSIDIKESLSPKDFARYFQHQPPDCAWLIQGGDVFDLLPLREKTRL